MTDSNRRFLLPHKPRLARHFKLEIADELGLLNKINGQKSETIDSRNYGLTAGTKIRKMVHQGFFTKE